MFGKQWSWHGNAESEILEAAVVGVEVGFAMGSKPGSVRL